MVTSLSLLTTTPQSDTLWQPSNDTAEWRSDGITDCSSQLSEDEKKGYVNIFYHMPFMDFFKALNHKRWDLNSLKMFHANLLPLIDQLVGVIIFRLTETQFQHLISL